MKTFLLCLLALVVLVGVYWSAALHSDSSTTPTLPHASPTVAVVSEVPSEVIGITRAYYTDPKLGFSFTYRTAPDGYVVMPQSLIQHTSDQLVSSLQVIRSDVYADFTQAQEAGDGRDGPPAFMVSVFALQSSITLQAWLLANVQYTNCDEENLRSSVVSGSDALGCLWDGLYLGITVAVLQNNHIYLLTGVRDGAETESGYSYEQDFNDLVASFVVQQD